MKKEVRTICYDDELHMEAYFFEGIVQPFPNHFHDYYVIGFIEKGTRCLSCKNQQYTIGPGNILLFNPSDNHGCVQSDSETFDYRGLNIPKETMQNLTKEVRGKSFLPVFTESVVSNDELNTYLHLLHRMIMNGSKEFEKEELLLLLISAIMEKYCQPFEKYLPDIMNEVERACLFMEKNYAQHMSLEELVKCSGLSKSTLLRGFTKSKGVTPYRYLQTIRINRAKELLEQGISPLEAAMQTGFSDQSHFSNYFNMFIGLSPAAYGQIFKGTSGDFTDGK